jgi:hypothetical protein
MAFLQCTTAFRHALHDASAGNCASRPSTNKPCGPSWAYRRRGGHHQPRRTSTRHRRRSARLASIAAPDRRLLHRPQQRDMWRHSRSDRALGARCNRKSLITDSARSLLARSWAWQVSCSGVEACAPGAVVDVASSSCAHRPASLLGGPGRTVGQLRDERPVFLADQGPLVRPKTLRPRCRSRPA